MPSALAATRNATERASTVQLCNETGLGLAWTIQTFDAENEAMCADSAAVVLNFPAHREAPRPHGSTLQRSTQHSLHLRLATEATVETESGAEGGAAGGAAPLGDAEGARAWTALSIDVGADRCTVFDVDVSSARYRVMVLSASGVAGLSADLFRAVVTLTPFDAAFDVIAPRELGRTGASSMVDGRILWNELLSLDSAPRAGVLSVSLCSATPHFVFASATVPWQDAVNAGVISLDLSNGAGVIVLKVTRCANESGGSSVAAQSASDVGAGTGTEVVCSVETSDSVKVVRLSSNLRIRNGLGVTVDVQYGTSPVHGAFALDDARRLLPNGSEISLLSNCGRAVSVPTNFSVETSGVVVDATSAGEQYGVAERFVVAWTDEGYLMLESRKHKGKMMTAHSKVGKIKCNGAEGGVWQQFAAIVADPRAGLGRASGRSALPPGYACSFALRTRRGEKPFWSMDAASGVMNASSSTFAATQCVFHIVRHDATAAAVGADAAAEQSGVDEVIEPVRSGDGGAVAPTPSIAPYASLSVPVALLSAQHAGVTEHWVRFREKGRACYAEWISLSAMAGRTLIGAPRCATSALIDFSAVAEDAEVEEVSVSRVACCYLLRDFAARPVGVRTWQLTPPLLIENQLPGNARLELALEPSSAALSGSAFMLQPLEQRLVYVGGTTATAIELRIVLPEMGLQSTSYDGAAPRSADNFATVKVSLDAFEALSAEDTQFVDYPVVLRDGQRHPLSLVVRARPGRIADSEPFAYVQIFCPYWIVNVTHLPFVYASKSASVGGTYEVCASNSTGLAWLTEQAHAKGGRGRGGSGGGGLTASASAGEPTAPPADLASAKRRRSSRFGLDKRSTVDSKVSSLESISKRRASTRVNALHHVTANGSGATLFSVAFADRAKPRLAAALPPSDDAVLIPGWGVAIDGTDVKWSQTPSLENVGLTQETSVARGGRIFPLAVTVHAAPGRFVLSKIVTISAQYTLVNETPFVLYIRQAVAGAVRGGGDDDGGAEGATIVEPGHVMHISWSEGAAAPQQLSLSVPGRMWSSPLSMDVGAVVVKLPLRDFDADAEGEADERYSDVLFLASDVQKQKRGGRRFHVRVVEAEQLRFKIVNDCTMDTLEVMQQQKLFRGGPAFDALRRRVAMRIAPMESEYYTWDDSTVESPLLLMRAEPIRDLLRSAVKNNATVGGVRTLASRLTASSTFASRWAEINLEELTSVGNVLVKGSDGAERKLWYSVSVEGTTFVLRVSNLISRCRPKEAAVEQRGDQAWLSLLFKATKAAERDVALWSSTTSAEPPLAHATAETLRHYHARLRRRYEERCAALKFEGMPLDEGEAEGGAVEATRARRASAMPQQGHQGRVAASLEGIAEQVEAQTYAASAAHLAPHKRELAVRIERVEGEGDLEQYVRRMAKEAGHALGDTSDIAQVIARMEAYVVISELDRSLPPGAQRRSRRSFVTKVHQVLPLAVGSQYKALFLEDGGPQFLGMSLTQRQALRKGGAKAKRTLLVAVEAVDCHSVADECGISVGDVLDRLVSSDGTEVTSLVGLSASAAWQRVREEPRPCIVYVRAAEYVDFGGGAAHASASTSADVPSPAASGTAPGTTALRSPTRWEVHLHQTLVFPPHATATAAASAGAASATSRRGLELRVYLLNPFAKRRVELRQKGSREAVERMLFFFGELDSTRLIQGDTAAGDERITLLDVCAGRCSMPIPLAHSRAAQEERQMEFGRWAKQVWLGRRKGNVTLSASWQRATFAPPKCNVAMRLALASVGVTLIDGGSRGGGAVVRSILQRNHRRYQVSASRQPFHLMRTLLTI